MAFFKHRNTFFVLPMVAAVNVALAQSAPPSSSAPAPSIQQIDAITVSAKASPVLDVDRADVGSFGQTIAKTPQSISVLSADALAANAVQTLSQAIKLDASLADSTPSATMRFAHACGTVGCCLMSAYRLGCVYVGSSPSLCPCRR